jgi:hypothetical protein
MYYPTLAVVKVGVVEVVVVVLRRAVGPEGVGRPTITD